MVNAMQAPEAPSMAFLFHQIPNLTENGPGYEWQLFHISLK